MTNCVKSNGLYSLNEASKILGISYDAFYKRIRKGLVRYDRVGWSMVIRGIDLYVAYQAAKNGEICLSRFKLNKLILTS